MKIHRSMSAGNKRILLLSLVVAAVLSLIPISSHAAVDWNESFEYANETAMAAVWTNSQGASGCPSSMAVSTARVRSGSKALKEHFTGHETQSCFMDRKLNGASDTLYTRWYVYMDNFVVDSISATKMVMQGTGCCYPSFWWVMQFGNPVLGISNQGIILDDGTISTKNTNSSGSIPGNQWVCVETRLTMSSPGVDNGIMQAWINGTQVMNVTTERMRAATLNQKNSPTVQFDLIRLYQQHGVGDIYYDDFAASRDARIGCNGTPPSADTTAPRPPSGLVVR